MLLRQMVIGVVGGAVLAVTALGWSNSGLNIGSLLHFAQFSTDWTASEAGAASTSPTSARTVAVVAPPKLADDSGDAAIDSGLSGDRASDAAGTLVAGWGAGTRDPKDESLDHVPVQDAEPAPAAPSAEVLDPNLYLGALSKQTIIRSEPRPDASILGFARTGALLRRAPIAATTRGCSDGWYRVEPEGYVCVGKAATLDPEHPIIQLASQQPDRSLPMPYVYGQSRYPTPPLYTKIPSGEEQAIAEQELASHLRKNFGARWAEAADVPPPSLLANGELVPRPYGYPVLEHEFMTGRALNRSAFAFMDLFEAGGRRWGLTTDLSILPLDRLTPVESSEFFGEVVSDAEDMPVAFMRTKGQYVYEGDPAAGKLRVADKIEYRQAFHLTGRSFRVGGAQFLETRDGKYIPEHERLVIIRPREEMPKWAKEDRSWIEVSIMKQTLVAYRGTRPIFATLVSTGRDGLGDPAETHSTVQGVFLIHTKHVSSTMSGDAADDEFDLRDVPYVQYFHEGYAFHAAFWHDAFGQPRSHGCINLSPPDARHLFSLTEPPVPMRWHSALSRKGTLVYIHP